MSKLLKRYDVIALVVFFVLAVVLERLEAFSLLEDETLSYRQILRTYLASDEVVKPSDDVVIVYTDEEFYSEYGKYPLTRVDLSTIVLDLKKMGAKVIAVDLLLDFNSAYGEDPTLEDAFQEAGNVLLVSQADFIEDEFIQLNRAIDRFAAVTTSGYSNITSNSTVREIMVRLRIHPEIAAQEEDGWPFTVQAVAAFLDAEPALEGNTLRIGEDLSVGLDQFNDMYIDYPQLPDDGAGSTQKLHDVIGISALDLIFAEDEEELEELSFLFDGKIALIGEVAEVAHDQFETPVGNVFGVEIIADIIATILKGAPLQAASLVPEILLTAVLMLGLFGTTFLQNPLPRTSLAAAVFIVYVAFVVITYIYQGTIYSMSYALIAGFLSVLVINLRFYLEERGQKTLIRAAFGQYLSPKIVSDLVKNPGKLTLGGEEREMTAYFSDIAGFSTFSETLKPTELVLLLNDYLTEMCNIIIGSEGTVDKFEGDAIVAFWGAPTIQPDHAKLACFASIEMNQLLAELRVKWAQQNHPAINVRMGLNTGEMLVGNMGSAQRMNYTMMGDAVNLAARLEGANKVYKSDVMISMHTYNQVMDEVDVRELDTIRVVGKSEATTVYQLLEKKGRVSGSMADLVDVYSQGLDLYKQREYAAAIEKFNQAIAIHDDDGPSLTYLDRCQQYLNNPPASDWDGVFTLDEKG
jgi:adenylate cyclase